MTKPKKSHLILNLSPEDTQAIKLYETHSAMEVSKITGLPYNRVRNLVGTYKPAKKILPWTGKEEKSLMDGWGKKTPTEIGVELGRTRWAVISKHRELKNK